MNQNPEPLPEGYWRRVGYENMTSRNKQGRFEKSADKEVTNRGCPEGLKGPEAPPGDEAPDVDPVLLGMLILSSAAKEGREQHQTVEALVALAWRTYGWNPETFHAKMAATQEAMKGHRVTYRFSEGKFGMQIYAD